MADIPTLRQQLDDIDNSLLALLVQRLAVADEIGELKGGQVFDPAREFALTEARVAAFAALPAPVVRQFVRDWVSLCRGHQGQFAIASSAPQLVPLLLGRYTQVLESSEPLAAVFAGQAQGALLPSPWPSDLGGLLPAACCEYEGHSFLLLTADGCNDGDLTLRLHQQRWQIESGQQFSRWPLLWNH